MFSLFFGAEVSTKYCIKLLSTPCPFGLVLVPPGIQPLNQSHMLSQNLSLPSYPPIIRMPSLHTPICSRRREFVCILHCSLFLSCREGHSICLEMMSRKFSCFIGCSDHTCKLQIPLRLRILGR